MSAEKLDNLSTRVAQVEHGAASRSEAVVDLSHRTLGHTRTVSLESDCVVRGLVCAETLFLPTDERAALVTGHSPQAGAALEAYKGLRTRLLKLRSSQGFRSIAVTSLCHGEGKTTTSLNLAHCFAQLENVSVLLIDADLRRRGLTHLLLGLPCEGIYDVLADDVPYSSAIARAEGTSLYAMGTGRRPASGTELFSSGRWADLMRWASAQFSITVVDTVSMSVPADLDLTLSQCDRTLLVVRSGNTRREDLRTATQHLDPNKLAGIVFNGSHGFKPEY